MSESASSTSRAETGWAAPLFGNQIGKHSMLLRSHADFFSHFRARKSRKAPLHCGYRLL